jgi:hypothetical protein
MAKSARTLRAISGLLVGVAAAAAIAVALTNPVAGQSGTVVQATETRSKGAGTMATHAFVGMWVTADGYIRHELLPNGRYDEARGSKRSAYQGRYVITGNHIDYVDDTGFTADGDFVDGVLCHAGMILRREN